jgi:hypothetical protein
VKELKRDAAETMGWWHLHGDGVARALDRSLRIARTRERTQEADSGSARGNDALPDPPAADGWSTQ